MTTVEIITIVATVFTSVLGSGGLWAFLTARENRKAEERAKDSLERQALLGLLYDRLKHLCNHYINKGWIGTDELADLLKYLNNPYVDLGGNGTVEALIKIVQELPHTPPRGV